MEDSHKALLSEIRERLDAAAEAPEVKNKNGTNYRAPRVTRAIDDREDDGPALVKYVKGAIRKTEAWNALMEGNRLDLSFEHLVMNAEEPVRSLFSDEDRQVAEEVFTSRTAEIGRKLDESEAVAVAQDRRIATIMGEKQRERGKPWTPEMEEKALARMAAERRGAN